MHHYVVCVERGGEWYGVRCGMMWCGVAGYASRTDTCIFMRPARTASAEAAARRSRSPRATMAGSRGRPLVHTHESARVVYAGIHGHASARLIMFYAQPTSKTMLLHTPTGYSAYPAIPMDPYLMPSAKRKRASQEERDANAASSQTLSESSISKPSARNAKGADLTRGSWSSEHFVRSGSTASTRQCFRPGPAIYKVLKWSV